MNNNLENNQIPIIIDTPFETVCGYLVPYPKTPTNLHIEENNSVIKNENTFNAENYLK